MLSSCTFRLSRVFRLAVLALTSSIWATQFSGFLFLFINGIGFSQEEFVVFLFANLRAVSGVTVVGLLLTEIGQTCKSFTHPKNGLSDVAKLMGCKKAPKAFYLFVSIKNF